MKIIKIDQDHPDPRVLDEAVKILLAQEVIIHPTETVYGLAGIYHSEKVLQNIISVKARPVTKPFSIMVSDLADILNLSGCRSAWLENLLARLFPAPLTILVPRMRQLESPFWNRFPLLGFRIPLHSLSRNLVQLVGIPLITTSVNLSGRPPATRIADVPAIVHQNIPLILDGGDTHQKLPSTVIRAHPDSQTVHLVRTGALEWKEIEKHIAEI